MVGLNNDRTKGLFPDEEVCLTTVTVAGKTEIVVCLVELISNVVFLQPVTLMTGN